MSEISSPITGNVARVLNTRELAINIGSESGVALNMRFAVLAPEPTKITDPKTGDVLGTVDREKTRVKVVLVEQKFSVCRTYRKKYVQATGFQRVLEIAGGTGEPSRMVAETLRVGDSDLPAPLPEEQSYVKSGDRVVQLTRDDDLQE